MIKKKICFGDQSLIAIKQTVRIHAELHFDFWFGFLLISKIASAIWLRNQTPFEIIVRWCCNNRNESLISRPKIRGYNSKCVLFIVAITTWELISWEQFIACTLKRTDENYNNNRRYGKYEPTTKVDCCTDCIAVCVCVCLQNVNRLVVHGSCLSHRMRSNCRN